MKIITISKIGYNHPSQANWNYGIWKVDTIDTGGYEYQMSYVVRENFGGDSRFRQALELAGIKVNRTKDVYTGTGTPKITGISKMQDMESKEFIAEIIKWYKSDDHKHNIVEDEFMINA